KPVQRGRIGEGSSFRDWCIVSLFVVIGGEGIEIEGDDRRPRGLCIPHTLDCRMQARHRSIFAANETNRLLVVLGRGSRPKLAGGGPIVDVDIVEPLTLQREDE